MAVSRRSLAMRSAVARSYYLLAAALLLSVLPLPQTLGSWQPPWLGVALIWLVLASSEDVRLMIAAAAGLIQDILSGAPLGLHAMAASFLVFLAYNLRNMMISAPPWQRFLLAMTSLAAYLLILALVGGWFGQSGSLSGLLGSLLSGGIVILAAFLFLRA
ncbi:rod shape-determining protein MreD [Candidatus Foliamicus sp.]